MLSDFLFDLKNSGTNLFIQQDQLGYRASKGSLTPKLKNEIVANKAKIIEFLTDVGADLSRVSRLSYSQQRLWFIDQLEGGSGQYNVFGEFRIGRELDQAAFERAVRELIMRHEALRTCICCSDGEPYQVIQQTFDLPIDYADLSGMELDRQARHLASIAAEDACRPFDLSKDLMLRMQVLKIAPDTHHAMFNMHHIASDAWSMRILIAEFAQLYTEFCEGRPNTLPPVKVQYSDYVRWQRELLSGSTLERKLGYWENKLKDCPEVHSLPLRGTRPARQSFDGQYYVQGIDSALCTALREMAEVQQVTMFMLLQTVFVVLIKRFSRSNDVVIGTPISGRDHRDLEGLVGFFANTLPLRISADDECGFDELLRRNKLTILDAFEHQQVPFDLLVDHLVEDRDLSHNPLIQLMFSLDGGLGAGAAGQGSVIEVLEYGLERTFAKFDLALRITERQDGFATEWTYATSLFDRATIKTLAAAYESMLEQIVANPQATVGELSAVTAAEAVRLSEWQAQPVKSALVPEHLGASSCFPLIADERQEPVPIGAIGELYLFGDGLAKAMSAAGEDDKAGFLLDEGRPGHRLYRTGQLVRYGADGELELVGPADSQVRFRGVSMNLQEVVAIIEGSDAIRDAIVLLEGGGDAQHLVVFAVPETVPKDKLLFLRSLRTWLRRELPGYLVPSAYELIDRRQAVAFRQYGRSQLPATARLEEAQFVEPGSATEQSLANIWQELLALSRVGVHDNFFALGGNSLTAVRLEFAIQERLAVQVATRDIFEHSTLGELAGLIDQRGVDGDEEIPSVPRGHDLPLSHSQRRLWFIHELQTAQAQYNIPIALHLKGELNQAALQHTLDTIVERHEILRTTYHSVDGQGRQRIHDPQPVPIAAIDITNLDQSDRPARARLLAETEAARPFSLEDELMLRAILITLDARRHVLVFNMHHIASDGWSVGLLLREFASLYGAFVSGREAALEPPAIQYADYAQWQNEWLQGNTLARYARFWKDALHGAPALHNLPLDRPRPAVMRARGGSYKQSLERSLKIGLNQVANDHEATLFMVLNAAYACLIARLSNEYDVVIGTAIANRDNPRLAPLVGCFVNTLALRTTLSPEQSFSNLLMSTKERVLSAYQHQQMPFDLLVAELMADRGMSHHPVFQLMLVMQNNDNDGIVLPGLELELLEHDTAGTEFDVLLSVTEDEDGLSCIWQYNNDIFDVATIERIAHHFAVLLRGVANAPHTTIDRLPIVSDAQHRVLVEQAGAIDLCFDKNACLQRLFERQVELHPDKIALEMNGDALTYRELNERANRLAHHLVGKGVAPDKLVAVYCDRRFELIVGVLGILKAGGAYLPVDPAYPQSRIRHMLEDSDVRWLLTTRDLVDTVPVGVEHVLAMDDGFTLKDYPSSVPDTAGPVTGEHLAYVIYTSGSTGGPKGVMVTHANVHAYLVASTALYQTTPDDIVLQFSSPSFDIFVEELATALCTGASLVLRTEEMLAGGEPFWSVIREKRITIMSFAAEFWRLLCRQMDDGMIDTGDLRLLTVGGEVMFPSLLQKWQRHVRPEVKLLNVYGPTEGTAVATYFDTASYSTADNSVPIGKPFANHRTYVLDKNRMMCPTGVVGELYLGGPSIARGYLNRPELSRRSFIGNPFDPHDDGRLYRTGDMVKQRDDGNIEFVGREDDQIKLRGYRIELSEIERQLADLGGVESSLLVVRSDERNSALIAYLIPSVMPANESRFISQIRKKLADRLPAFMLPGAYVILDQMPVTPNGKIDRAALPAPDMSGQHEFCPPASACERQLAAIWKKLLVLDKVSVDASFFELGGHSLLVTRLASEIADGFGVDLSLRALFEHHTLKDQAALIGKHEGVGRRDIPLADRTRPLPLSFAQQRLWFVDKFEIGTRRYNMPTAFRIDGDLDLSALERALSDVIARHEVLRTVYLDGDDGQGVQKIVPPRPIEIAKVDLSSTPEAERAARQSSIANEEAKKPFDLSADLMLRATVIRHSSQNHVLLVTMHHIASDGWSLDILVSEFVALYTSYMLGVSAFLKPLPIQYADFAKWNRESLTGRRLDKQLDYWRAQLHNLPRTHHLPVRQASGADKNYGGRRIFRKVEGELVSRLEQLAADHEATLNMTLHAALAVLLGRWSNEYDIVVGTPVSGRMHPQLAPLIGFFVNNLVLRSDLSDNPSFTTVLMQSRRVALEAYENQEVPFDALVNALYAGQSVDQMPLFQIMYAFQDNDDTTISVPGLRLTDIVQENEFARFELTLNANHRGDHLTLCWEYMTSAFEAQTIEALARGFEALLQAIVDRPRAPIAELPAMNSNTFETLSRIRRQSIDAALCPPSVNPSELEGWIVDGFMNCVPPGVEGELVLAARDPALPHAGRCVAALTDQTGGEPAHYRTGKRARYDGQGSLQICGDADRLLRHRGNRLRLDGLESELAKNPYVVAARIGLLETNGEPCLAAFVEPSESVNDPDRFLTAIRQWLKSRQPAHCIPDAFAVVSSADDLGDLAALQESLVRLEDVEHVAPQSETEEKLARIWSELLSVERIGTRDDFFVLGGSSLTAVRLEFAILENFDASISVRDIFETPQLGKLAARLEASGNSARDIILPAPRKEKMRLSYAQRRLWFIDQLEENDSHHYNIPWCLRLRGTLNQVALKRALHQLVQRHEVLRTTYQTAPDGEGYQLVQSGFVFALTERDLRQTPAERRLREVDRLAQTEASKPFDISRDPMLRGTLMRLGEDDWVLMLNMHHIASDGWSMGIIIGELAELYTAYVRGSAPDLTDLPIQYADYAAWQADRANTGSFERQMAYWRDHLAGLPALHGLPLDAPRLASPSFAGAVLRQALPKELVTQLSGVANAANATLFMAMQAAFVVLLNRWSNEDEIVIGTPISGRTRLEMAPLVGFFVNTLVLRHDLSGDLSYEALLKRVKSTTLSAFENQDVPFDLLVDNLDVERNVAHTPLFQVLFTLQDNPAVQVSLPDLDVTPLDLENRTAKFELSLHINVTEEGTEAAWEYATDLFAADTIERMSRHFVDILGAVSVDPGVLCKTVPLVGEEKCDVFHDNVRARTHWEPAVFERYHGLHERFQECARSNPKKTAAVCGLEKIDYAELNQRSNQLARLLIDEGVDAGDFVGLYVERSIDMLIGLLGIIKAGAAYVPLDPAYPASRIEYLIDDAGISIVLTQRCFGDGFLAGIANLVHLDSEQHRRHLQVYKTADLTPAEVSWGSDRAAYVIYTSGSTGKPKGVVIEHSNVLRLFESSLEYFEFGADDCWTMFHSFAFDFSVWEIWGALLFGGKLVMVPFEVSRSATDFYCLLRQHDVTVLSQTPSAFYSLIDEVTAAPVSLTLRYVVFGGEALEFQRLTDWIRCYGDQKPELVNMYGITETTVHVTYRRVFEHDSQSTSSVIGRPLRHLSVYVCNEAMQRQPIGVPGELFVGGDGLASRYLNRPELTAERFIDNPFAGPHPLLYRTGDLVRWTRDGELQYLGRIDSQAKLRGHRIELGEIEYELCNTDVVKEALVLVAEAQSGHRQLVAYVVPAKEGIEGLAMQLRTRLSATLPDYMIPSHFVPVDSMPLTTNGKVDRAALQRLHRVEVAHSEYVAPVNELQSTLCEIWATALERPAVGIRDNFFAIGGDSIRVIRIVKQAERRGIYLQVRDIFARQTVEELATHCEFAADDRSVPPAPVPMHLVTQALDTGAYLDVDTEDCFPVTELQRTMLDRHLETDSEFGVYQPQILFEIEGRDIVFDLLVETLVYLAARHPNLRSSFAPTPGGGYVQKVARTAAPEVKLVDMTGTPRTKVGAKLSALIEQDQREGFELTQACIRFKLIRFADRRCGLFVSTHHAIEDGWGFVELSNQIFDVYTRLERGEGLAKLDDTSHVFKEHVALELECRDSAEYERVWRSLLSGYRAVDWPAVVDEYAPRFKDYQPIQLRKKTVANLTEFARLNGVPLKTLLLLAYNRALMKLADADHMVVDVVTSGRSSRLSDPLYSVGLFWNLLPVFTRHESIDTVAIKGMADKLLQVDGYAQYPIDRIHEIVGTKDVAYAAFNFVNFRNQRTNADAKISLQFGSDAFHHPLKLALAQEGDEIAGQMEYSRRHFKKTQIKTLCKYFEKEAIGLTTMVDRVSVG